MVTRAQFGPWEIEYDREATQAAYVAMDDAYCDCQSCRNYVANAPFFPEAVRQFFDSLGIDPAKPSDITSAVPPPPWNGPLSYTSNLYCCFGRIVSGPELRNYAMSKNFGISFLRELYLNMIPGEISKEQALLIEISITLPWLLDEPYTE